MSATLRTRSWKWMHRLLSNRPWLDCQPEGAHDLQRFELSGPGGRAVIEVSEETLSVLRADGGGALLSLDRAARMLRTEAAATVLGEVVDPLSAPSGPAHETNGRTRAAWLITFEALGLHAGPSAVPARTLPAGAWRAGRLVFSRSGTVLGPNDQVADLLHPAWTEASKHRQKAALALFAQGNEVPELPRLQSCWRVNRARQALFPPSAPGHVLVCQEDGHWTALHHVEMGRQRLNTDAVRGWGALWSGPRATWLLTEHGQALRIPASGNFGMYGDSEQVDTPLRALPNTLGPCPALLAAGDGVLVVVDPGQHTLWILGHPPEDGRELVSQLSNMSVSAERGTPGGFKLGQLAVAGDTVFSSSPGFEAGIFDLRGAQRWRATVSAEPDGHPVGAALHPDGRLALLVSRTLCFFDVPSGRRLYTVRPPADLAFKPAAAFSPDGRFLALQFGPALVAMDLITRQVRHLISIQDDSDMPFDSLPAPSALGFSPDGQHLFTSRTNMHVFRWAELEATWRRAPDLDGWAMTEGDTVSPGPAPTSRSA